MTIEAAAQTAKEASIHFPIQPDRKLYPSGRSDWRGLSVLFTLDETALLEKRGNDYFYRYQTDAEGLRDAARLGSHAAEAIADGLVVIGTLLAHAEHCDLDVGDLGAIGLLVCGLGELSKQVNEATYEAARALNEGRHLQANMNPR